MTIWTNQNREDDSDDENFLQSVLKWSPDNAPASNFEASHQEKPV